MARAKKKTTDAAEIMRDRYIKNSRKRAESVLEERAKADIATQIYDMRIQADVTQSELAKLVGTTQSVISRLEGADYNGYTLNMLERIALALHCRVEFRLVPEQKHAFA